MSIAFDVQTVLKDDCFTKSGKLRRNKKLRKGIADLIKWEAHKFIEAHSTDDIVEHAIVEIEEVEVLDEDKS